MALIELEEFQGPQFLGFVRNIPAPAPFLGSRWLPDRTVFDLEVEYIKAAQDRPVMAEIMGWDSEAPISPRPGLGETVRHELPPIKRKSRISEKEIIRFLSPRAGTPDRQTAIDAVYADTARLVRGVQARVEWMRMQALSEDTLTYDEGGVEFSFDYGIDADFQFNVGTGPGLSTWWSDTATSTPIADLQAMLATYNAKHGFDWTTLVVSKQIIPYLLQNADMKDQIYGTAAPGRQLTNAEQQALFATLGLPNIVVYDAVVYQENDDGSITQHRPLDPKKGILLPEGQVPIGNTLWGPTAESRALIGTNLASVAPGIFPIAYGKEDPPSEWVKVAAVSFPSMPGADHIGQVQLLEP
jgi:hypothetical protein